LQFRLFTVLLRPSLLSGLGSLIGAAALLVLPNLVYLEKQSFFYEIFFGPKGLTTTLEDAHNSTSAFAAALSELPLTYTILMFAVSVLAGGFTYIVLQALHRIFVDVAEPISDVLIAGSSRMSVEKEIGLRVVVRIVSFIAWCGYWLATIKILWPFSILIFRSGALEPTTSRGVGYMALALGLMTIGLHLHVVFLRLTLLRPRAFGGERAIQQALYK
jgi:hypothetical protein